MGTTLITGSSKSTAGEVNFGTFGRGFLLGFGFLEPRRLGRSPRFTELEMVFLFLSGKQASGRQKEWCHPGLGRPHLRW